MFCFALLLVIQLQVLEHKLCRQELCVPMSKGCSDLGPTVCVAALRAPLTRLPSTLWQVRTPKAVGWDKGLNHWSVISDHSPHLANPGEVLGSKSTEGGKWTIPILARCPAGPTEALNSSVY